MASRASCGVAAERHLIGGQYPLHPVCDMPAGQGRSADILDVLIKREGGARRLSDKLFPPLRTANLVAKRFAVIHDFDVFDSAAGGEPDRIGDEFVLADDFIDN